MEDFNRLIDDDDTASLVVPATDKFEKDVSTLDDDQGALVLPAAATVKIENDISEPMEKELINENEKSTVPTQTRMTNEAKTENESEISESSSSCEIPCHSDAETEIYEENDLEDSMARPTKFSQVFFPLEGKELPCMTMSPKSYKKNQKPFIHNYELANERNRNRYRYQVENKEFDDKLTKEEREARALETKEIESQPAFKQAQYIEDLKQSMWLLEKTKSLATKLSKKNPTRDPLGAVDILNQIYWKPLSEKTLLMAYPAVNTIKKCMFYKDSDVKKAATKVFYHFHSFFAIHGRDTFENTFSERVIEYHKVDREA